MLPCLITRETKTVRICTCELVLCTMPIFLTANMRPSMMPSLMEIAISTKRQFKRGKEKSLKNNQCTGQAKEDFRGATNKSLLPQLNSYYTCLYHQGSQNQKVKNKFSTNLAVFGYTCGNYLCNFSAPPGVWNPFPNTLLEGG